MTTAATTGRATMAMNMTPAMKMNMTQTSTARTTSNTTTTDHVSNNYINFVSSIKDNYDRIYNCDYKVNGIDAVINHIIVMIYVTTNDIDFYCVNDDPSGIDADDSK